MDFNLVLFHGNCPDGRTAAFIYWLFSNKNPDVVYHECFHGSDHEIPDCTNKKVLMLDFSLNAQKIQAMIDIASSFLIIDHHITAIEGLKDIPDKYKIFDIKESGASLTWKTFFPSAELPLFVKYIRSYDIWTKDQPFTDEFATAFDLYPFSFQEYEKLLDPAEIAKLIEKGKSYLEYKFYIIKNIPAAKFTIEIDGKNYVCAYITTVPKFISDLGNMYLEENKDVDFCVIYRCDLIEQKTSYSFRSKQFDVAALAQRFNGGGHKCAAGCSVNGLEILLPSFKHMAHL